MGQKPSIGRIVHFFEGAGAQPRAAIIVVVWSEHCVNLQIFPTGKDGDVLAEVRTSVMHCDAGHGSGWDWPPRVE